MSILHFKKMESVGTLPILPHLKVEMVSGRASGSAHITNYLALFHFLSYSHADRGTVCIQSVEGIIVVELNVVSIPAAPRVDGVGNGDSTVCCGPNGSFTRCADIGSVVVSDFPCEGILTVPKL